MKGSMEGHERKTTTYGSVTKVIREMLRTGPKTTREIADRLNKPSQEVTPWLYRLKRQGEIRKLTNGDRGRYGERSSLWEAANLKCGRTAKTE